MNRRYELPVGNLNHQNGYIKPRTDEFKTVGKIKFKDISHFYSDKNADYFRGFKGFKNVNIVVRRVRLTENMMKEIQNDIYWSTELENKFISSVLKFDDLEIDQEMAYIPYEPFWLTLECFFNLPTENLNIELFTNISRGIIEAIGNVHAEQILLNNIELTNMAYCVDNREPKIKLFNLSAAERLSEVHEYYFANDIRDTGIVLLSIVIKDQNIIEEIKKMISAEKIEEFICEKWKNINFIESYKKRSFAYLVGAMLTTKDKLIQNYLNYPFFWNDAKIEEVIKITNSWVDKNGKRNQIKGDIFDKQFKDIIQYDWTPKVKSDGMKVNANFMETGSEFLRFLRNKVVHYKDYKDENASFFEIHQGPYKYFFDKFEPFFHMLSRFFEVHKLHETDRIDGGTDDDAPDDGRGDGHDKDDKNDKQNPKPSTSKGNQNQQKPKSGIYNSNNNRDTNPVISSGGKNNQLRDQERKIHHKNKSISCYTKLNHQNSNASYKYSTSGKKYS